MTIQKFHLDHAATLGQKIEYCYLVVSTSQKASMDGMVQQALEANLLQVAKTFEDQIDAQLHQLENLDEDDLERIRQRRIDEMKR